MPTNQKLLRSVSMAVLVSATVVVAQTNENSEETATDSVWIGVVTADNASVRCGANESYYTIAAANQGDLVQIHGKRQDWIKIDTSGSVFANTIGYIKYPASDITLFEVTESGGVAKSDIEVLAKNTSSEELYRSWRPILRLQDGDSVQIIDSMITEPGTLHRDSYVVHTVRMPSNAMCWINATNITRATPQQSATFYGTAYGAPQETNVVTTAQGSTTEINEVSITETELGETTMTNTVEATRNVTLEPLTLAELEAAWNKITAEPVMGAEVSPLKDMYAELLTQNSGDLVINQIAGGRMKQLGVWAGLQGQRIRIELLRSNLAEQSDDVNEYQAVMSMYGDYALAGTLALSNTFDGRLRPFMYRIQDPKSGRTLGYLPANADWELSGLVGQTIGVVGKKKWDASWRVNVVEANRFDILSPTTATVTPDIQ